MTTNDATWAFVHDHRTDDVRQLALRYAGHDGIDMPFALDQIQGWQTARGKLPSWAATDGIVYPPHLNMEQCSSEATARYKASLLSGLNDATLIDLTGGLGVDFAFMAPHFARAVYVERDERLCKTARHNFGVLRLENTEVVNGDGTKYLTRLNESGNRRFIYIDPARRDSHGRKVYGIEDCTPDVLALKDTLLARAYKTMIKLSPMLDWHAAAKAFAGACREVHIVSVANECKELLLVVEGGHDSGDSGERHQIRLACVNDGQRFETMVTPSASTAGPTLIDSEEAMRPGRCLLVPNASVMKAGTFAAITEAFHVAMADRDSHLFFGDDCDTNGFPGRRFVISEVSTMNKRELRQKLAGLTRANVSVRNFPMSAESLRRRLRLADGGDTFVFATTALGKHWIIVAKPLHA